MKYNLITITFIILLVGVTANSYQNGVIFGIVSGKLETQSKPPSKYNIIYNIMIMDTNLTNFPKHKLPICYSNKVKIYKYSDITFVEKFYAYIILFCIIIIPLHICDCCTHGQRDFLMGYLIGRMIEDLLGNDND